jgi:hypothetical protein
MRCRFLIPDFSTFHEDRVPKIRVLGSRNDADLGHGADGRQRFPAESQGLDVAKVFFRGDFACGVALDGQAHFLWGHAATVIGNEDSIYSTVLDLHTDFCGSGVEAIFQKLLQDGGRPIHHLACSNFSYNLFGEPPDPHPGNIGLKDPDHQARRSSQTAPPGEPESAVGTQGHRLCANADQTQRTRAPTGALPYTLASPRAG